MNILVSVIIPSHNPNQLRLQRALDSLRKQTLANNKWEIIIIDNASIDPQYIPSFDLSWHESSRVIVENKLGLTRSRLTGIQASRGKYIVFVDDDNELEPHYLERTIDIFNKYPSLGAIGGKVLPEFAVIPEKWIKDFWVCLALRDFGEESQIYFYSHLLNVDKQYPFFAPIGAGMCLQRSAAKFYAHSLIDDSRRLMLDRTGKKLQSGGDCDINLTLIEAGWGIGYFPQLQLTHLISTERLTREYLARVNYASSKSWVHVLELHNIRPWNKIARWSVIPRKIKAFFSLQAWKSSSNFIRWNGACGVFDGLSNLNS
jgi:glycosyltransferase involved in cell wall biosynthesis